MKTKKTKKTLTLTDEQANIVKAVLIGSNMFVDSKTSPKDVVDAIQEALKLNDKLSSLR